jgi:hypothetical protein
MPAQISLRILAFHFPCAFYEMNVEALRAGSAAQQYNQLAAYRSENQKIWSSGWHHQNRRRRAPGISSPELPLEPSDHTHAPARGVEHDQLP